MMKLWKFQNSTTWENVCDALDQLMEWNKNANPSGNYLMRNLHTAERLVRVFLFEFRTCLDYMETRIKENYGTKTTLWKIYARNTSKQYQMLPEYAFTSHLRNCAQHIRNVVHGFNGRTRMGISSNSQCPLKGYSEWKPIDKAFIQSAGDEIDLLTTFSKAFGALNTAIKPVMEYLLNNNHTGKKIVFLRQWGDCLCKNSGHDIHCHTIVDIQFKDGRSATKEDMASGDIIVKAYAIDWELVYELSDSILQVKKKS